MDDLTPTHRLAVQCIDAYLFHCDTVTNAVDRMRRMAKSSPQLFAKIGAEIAFHDDSTVDSSATFLNTSKALAAIVDPAIRAAAGNSIYGRGWMTVAVATADADPVRVLEDVARGVAFRDALADLADKARQVLPPGAVA